MNKCDSLEEIPTNSNNAILFVDIIEFIQESWKKLLGAGILGAALGLSSWFFFTNYKAELTFQNNGTFNFISWRSTEKFLPSLATEMLDKKAVTNNQTAIYIKISNAIWWDKNLQVIYGLSKKEAKDLAAISKDLDGISSSILGFTITTKASSEAKALEELEEVRQFFVNGAAYIAIKNLLNDYESKSLAQEAFVQQRILAVEVDLAYLKERLKNLELLQKRFPSITSSPDYNLLRLSEKGEKYLPLSMQIIATASDINTNKEELERLNDELIQFKIYRVFLENAAPIISERYDGLAMLNDIVAVLEKMRAKTAPGDIKTAKNLEAIRTQLLDIKVRFSRLLEQNTFSKVNNSDNIYMDIVVGFLITSLAMLVILLGQRAHRTIRFQRDHKWSKKLVNE